MKSLKLRADSMPSCSQPLSEAFYLFREYHTAFGGGIKKKMSVPVALFGDDYNCVWRNCIV